MSESPASHWGDELVITDEVMYDPTGTHYDVQGDRLFIRSGNQTACYVKTDRNLLRLTTTFSRLWVKDR